MHSVSRVKLSKSSPKTSKYLQRLRNNSEFLSKSRFLGYGRVLRLDAVCTAFLV
jgi:hypothetical protein